MIELRRAATVVLLFLGVGIALHLLLDPMREAGESAAMKTMVLAIGLSLAVLGVMGGYLIARLPKERIDDVTDHLEAMIQRGTMGLVIGESQADALGRLGHAVNHYLTFVKDEIEQSHMTAKERQIQVKVLEAEKRHVEAVIHAISDGVIVTDAFGDLILANEAAERTFGFHFDSDARRPIDEIIRDEQFLALLTEMRETGLHVPHRTVEWTRHEGQPAVAGDRARTFRVTLDAVVQNKKGDRISGVVAVLNDVTKEKEVASLKNEFVSNVSHELKAPLASIKAYVEMLLDGEVNDAASSREFLQTIANETDRLNRLIERILNLSRLESGLVAVNKTDLAVTEVLREVADVIGPQAAQKGVKLEADLAPVFFRVHADHDMLYQAVLNVVSNAVKYTAEGGLIRLSTYLDDGSVVVDVSDNGSGIPEEELDRIFEKFYRARSSSGDARGTGLGLALVKHVVETVHGGRVAVESKTGNGTVFRLYLPAVR